MSTKAKARDEKEDERDDEEESDVEDAIDQAAEGMGRDDKDRAVIATPAGYMERYQWSWLKNTWTILRREFWSYFDSPLAYIVLCISLIACGGYFFFLEGNFWQVDQASMGRMFQFFPLTMSLVCSVITMRSLAEEKRLGTLELLITMPVRDSEVIMGKFFAALALVLVLLLASLLYPVGMFLWPWHLGTLDWGVIWTSYLGLILWASAAIAIGMLFSSLTESQIVAFFCTYFTLNVLYAIGLVVEMFKGWLGDSIAFISFQTRYADFARGLIDTRAVVYFLSIAVLSLIIAFRNLESRKWS